MVAIEAVRRLGREYDRRLVAASRARQRKEAVAGGFGPACKAQGDDKECPKKKAQREAAAAAEKATSPAGGCCSKRNVGSSSSSETGSQTDDDIRLADEKRNSRDLEADLPVFK